MLQKCVTALWNKWKKFTLQYLKKKIEVLVISFLYFRMIQALKCANTLHEKVDETPTSETGTCGDHSVKFSHKIYMQH